MIIPIIKFPQEEAYTLPNNVRIGDEYISLQHRFHFNRWPKPFEKDKWEELNRWKEILIRPQPILRIEDVDRTVFLKKIGDGVYNPSLLYPTIKLKGLYAYIHWKVIDIAEESKA